MSVDKTCRLNASDDKKGITVSHKCEPISASGHLS